MTERLTALMTAEADLLDVPPAPTATVLSRGRTLRRRRRGLQVGTGLAALALVAGVGLAVTSGSDERGDALDPSGSPSAGADAPDLGAVFAIGPDVHLTGVDVVADIDDVTVKSMYYTSAGVLVRHGDNSYSDGGGPQRFSLVTPEGEVNRLSVVTNEVVPGVDTEQSLLAYAEVVDGTVEVVVHDVVADEEVTRIPVPDARKWGGWSAPPVSLVGDDVYVGTDDVARVVDWRTREVREDPSIDPGYPPEVFGGRTLAAAGSATTVVDATSGQVLLSIDSPEDGYTYASLSPDGRYALAMTVPDFLGGRDLPEPTQEVYGVDTGESAMIEVADGAFGWTPGGDLVSLDGSGVLTTCDTEGTCSTEQLDLEVLPDSLPGAEDFSDDLVLGNEVRES